MQDDSFEHILLMPEQKELLSMLVEAARNPQRDKRTPFFIGSYQQQGDILQHSSLPNLEQEVYIRDIRQLEREGLIDLWYTGAGQTPNLDVTPKGFAYYDWMKRRTGQLLETVETKIRSYRSYKSRVFLCHAKEDKPRVEKLYHQLKGAGYHPWLDKYDLLPGQDWWEEIEKIIRDRDNLVVVCLSCNSVTKKGMVQKEIKRALDVLDEMPEDTIYLIPARLEPCEPPLRLSKLHWVNLFEPDGFDNLKKALDFELSKRQLPVEPELIHIPAGEFLMGSDPKKDKDASENEQPQHTLYLPEYYIAKTPVTNAQYMEFVKATGDLMPRHWKGGTTPEGREDHPVVYVSWHEAMAYCRWLAETRGKPYRLPSEAEWEKAARGTDGKIYPWGNEWDAKRCNNWESGPGETTPVGQYSPRGDSPYGCVDMVGNVSEWTISLWSKDLFERPFKYPYDLGDGREDVNAEGLRVMRGGSWESSRNDARCAYREGNNPNNRWELLGFRIVVSPISP
jgi:formylglycine-generating enzyme required for sulfatase activity